MKKTFQTLFGLFLTFAKIGLFTFGGGYAMISVIEDICVEKKQWITHDEMMRMVIIAESTPGPVAINCATFVGYKQKKTAGAVAATIGVVLPSFVIIYLLSVFLDRFLEIPLVAKAFYGIKLAVGLLIIDAAVKMFRKMKKTPLSLVIAGVAFSAMLVLDLFAVSVSTVWFLLAAAAIGVALALTDKKGGEDA